MKSRTVQPIRRSSKGRNRPLYERESGKKRGIRYFDYNLLIVVIFLMCFGLVMLYSTSSYSAQAKFGNSMYYFSKQALISAICFVGMLVVAKIDYHLYAPFSVEIFLASMFLMALVRWSPLGVESYGSRRWIRLPGNMTLQPSEMMKVAVILLIPYILCKMGNQITTGKGFLKVTACGVLAACSVFYLTDNLSTAVIVLAITMSMIFVVHPKTVPFVGAALAGIVVFLIGAQILIANFADSDNFRMRRILAWLQPGEYASDGNYQVTQALYAIGSGQFFGKGLGNSTQKMIIPEVQNDMILSIVCEELGVFGAIIILVLFAIMLYRLMFIAQNAPDMYGALVATGIFAHIAVQVILNIGVVTKVLPTTGITLPFISYGGTSVMFLMVEMGIALGISTKIKIIGE